jgi:hypothetical protein
MEGSYYNAKGEDVGRFVELALEMCLWTAPIVVASQHSFDAPAFGKVARVFKIDDLHLFNYGILAILAADDHDIVWLNI